MYSHSIRYININKYNALLLNYDTRLKVYIYCKNTIFSNLFWANPGSHFL